jgi:hypothetical protein
MTEATRPYRNDATQAERIAHLHNTLHGRAIANCQIASNSDPLSLPIPTPLND